VWSIIKTLYWNSREVANVTGVPALRDSHRDDGSTAGEASNLGDVDQRNISSSGTGNAVNSSSAGDKNSGPNNVGSAAATGSTKQRDSAGSAGNAGSGGTSGGASGAASSNAANRTDGNAGESATVVSGEDEIDGDEATEIFQNGTPMGLPAFSRKFQSCTPKLMFSTLSGPP